MSLVSCFPPTDRGGTGGASEGANGEDQALVWTTGQRNEQFWLGESKPRLWKPGISGLPQRRQQMKVDLSFRGQHIRALFTSTLTGLSHPWWQRWLTLSIASLLSILHLRIEVFNVQWELLLWNLKGGKEKNRSVDSNTSVKVKPHRCNSTRMRFKITDSFLHAISSFWYELNKSGNFSKIGTLICLSRNPPCWYDAQCVCYMEGQCGMWAADSPVVLSCFVFLFLFFGLIYFMLWMWILLYGVHQIKSLYFCF